MLTINFYLLASENEQQRSLFCCKLVEKAYRHGYFSYIFTDSEQQSRLFNHLLWTFRANSFIPHELYQGTLPPSEQVILIGSQPPLEPWQRMIINVSNQPVNNILHTERLLEIVNNDPQRKQQARNRYRYYQQQGFSLKTTPIS